MEARTETSPEYAVKRRAPVSRADENLTHNLKQALALIDVRVLDNFVVGENIVSFAERGLL